MFFVYVLLYYLPFIIHNYLGTTAATWLLTIAFITQIFFACIEIIQMRDLGMVYVSDFWNYIDIVQPVIYFFFYASHLGSEAENEVLSWFEVLAKLILILLGFLKMMFFIRIFDDYSFMITLVWQTIEAAVPFINFLMMWIMVFALCYQALGVKVDEPDNPEDKEYPLTVTILRYFFYAYRTSIGDIAVPDYSYWSDESEGGYRDSESEEYFAKYSMIYIIYLVWFTNQQLCLIILLNFLIANISAKYEEIMEEQVTFDYMQKVYLNSDFNIFKRFLKLPKPAIHILVFTNVAQEEEEEDKFEEFVDHFKATVENN